MTTPSTISSDNPHFMTSTIFDREHIFTSLLYFEIIIESLKNFVETKGLSLHAYVVMSNHVHYVVSTSNGGSIAEVMRDLHAYTEKEIASYLQSDKKTRLLRVFHNAAKKDGGKREYKIWRDGFDPVPIVGKEKVLQMLNFIHENPVRRGYVDKPEHWQFSSARNYLFGDHSIIKVDCL